MRYEKNPTTIEGGNVGWFAVISFDPGSNPTFAIDSGQPFPIYGNYVVPGNRHKKWHRISFTGSVELLLGDFTDSIMPYAGFSTIPLEPTNETDSGPVAIAAGVNPTAIVAANPGRGRGVSVQNVGLTAIAVGKSALLRQDLTKGGLILAADSAANAGNGGVVTFDGWSGGVWGVNVAGGPGSVLVSAY